MEESAVAGKSTEPEILWAPSAEMVERSPLTRYMRWLADERELHFEDYHALWRWSTTEIEEFWRTIWDHFEVMASGEDQRELEDPSPDVVLEERVMPGADWFPGTELNYAEHIFRGKADDEVALVYASELRELSELRWGELRERVAAVREGLRALGVTRGDRVVAYLPNGPEAVIAFLAAASLGATWSSCSPDFGPAQRRRPLRADRAEGAVLRRRLPLRRQGLRPARHDRRDRLPDPEPRADRRRPLPERLARAIRARGAPERHPDDLGSAPGPRRRRRARLRPGPLRPSPLGPLLLRHHRPAQGDRPRPRRHPARAAQEGLPAPRRQDRRPRLLVHHDRLDDVELPGRRPPHPGLDRSLRRQPRHARTWASSGISPSAPA